MSFIHPYQISPTRRNSIFSRHQWRIHSLNSDFWESFLSFADRFATDWIDSWSEHNIDRILAHYADDFEMSSPRIPIVTGELSGTLRGKSLIRAYWAKALQLVPDLHFDLVATLVGVNSITLYYNGVRGPSAEVFHFDQDGKVTRAYAHYL